MKKRKYMTPNMEVEWFDVEDIITGSNDYEGGQNGITGNALTGNEGSSAFPGTIDS